VGLLDVLRGQRTPRRADLDALFAIGGAAMTLQAGLGIVTAGRAGVCFKEIEAGRFEALVRETEDLLRVAAPESGTTVTSRADEHGFHWVIIDDPDVEDLATTTHMVSRSLEEGGFSERLLCAVFGFRGADGPVFIVYAYKRGTFYPFVPREGRSRDNALELRLQGVLGSDLPIEPELERWYPLWDLPVGEAAEGS
jgi:PspA associated protein B